MYQHLRLVIEGSYKAAALAAETWAMGINLRAADGTAGDWGDLPTDQDFEPAEVSRVETNWGIESSFTMKGTIGSRFDPADYLNDQAGPAVAAFIAAPNVVHDNVRVDRLLLYGYEDARVAQTPIGPARAELTWKTPNRPDGAAAGVALPTETAVCVSLRTPVNGRRGRGRIYLPQHTASNLSSDFDGRLKPATTTAIANETVTFLRALTYSGLPPGYHVDPIVTGGTFQRFGRITSVQVGDVLDSQSRRRRQIPETYASATV